jgi:hypothetical protein
MHHADQVGADPSVSGDYGEIAISSRVPLIVGWKPDASSASEVSIQPSKNQASPRFWGLQFPYQLFYGRSPCPFTIMFASIVTSRSKPS